MLFCDLLEGCFGLVGLFCLNLISEEGEVAGILLNAVFLLMLTTSDLLGWFQLKLMGMQRSQL